MENNPIFQKNKFYQNKKKEVIVLCTNPNEPEHEGLYKCFSGFVIVTKNEHIKLGEFSTEWNKEFYDLVEIEIIVK